MVIVRVKMESLFIIMCKIANILLKILKSYHFLILLAGAILLVLLHVYTENWYVINVAYPFVIAVITSDIFYLFITKWPAYKMEKIILSKLEKVLLDILHLEEKEFKFLQNQKNRDYLHADILERIGERKKSKEAAKLILQIWSPHISKELLRILWDIADDHEKSHPESVDK